MDNSLIRISIFLGTFLTFALLEMKFSYRRVVLTRKDRWPANLSLLVFGNVLSKIILPLGLAGFATFCVKKEIGLLNSFDTRIEFDIIFTVLILDFLIYLQHFISHKWGLLWRFHRVHHSDPDLDVSSALRFHPIEIVLSLIFKLFFVFALGLNAKGVLIFEIILSSMAIFNHSNFHIHKGVEPLIRLLFVTPQMHIIHHSIYKRYSDKNFGFNLSIWDRIFGTYVDRFKDVEIIGLKGENGVSKQSLIYLLKRPFKKEQL